MPKSTQEKILEEFEKRLRAKAQQPNGFNFITMALIRKEIEEEKQFLSNALTLQEQEIRKEEREKAMNEDWYKKTYTEDFIKEIRKDERERCLKCVPDNKLLTNNPINLNKDLEIIGFNACRQQVIDNINKL